MYLMLDLKMIANSELQAHPRPLGVWINEVPPTI